MPRLRWRVVPLATLAGAGAMAGTGAVAISLGPVSATTIGDDADPLATGVLFLAVVVVGMTVCVVVAALVVVGSDERTANLARLVEAYRCTCARPGHAGHAGPPPNGRAPVPPPDDHLLRVRRLGARRRGTALSPTGADSFHTPEESRGTPS